MPPRDSGALRGGRASGSTTGHPSADAHNPRICVVGIGNLCARRGEGSTGRTLGARPRPPSPRHGSPPAAQAARLQEPVPDAVLVGVAAAALYAGHREPLVHDHVLTDLAARFEQILEAVEAASCWATSVRRSSPPTTTLGSLDGAAARLR